MLCSSCKQQSTDEKLRKVMGTWYKKQIEFPKAVELVNTDLSGLDSNHISLNRKDFYVVHFFTADCDKCVDQLKNAQAFINANKDLQNVSFLFIASGATRYYTENAIKEVKFKFPVYYEKKYYSFKELNHLEVDNPLYDTMVVDSSGKLLLFAAVFSNTKALDLLHEILKRKA